MAPPQLPCPAQDSVKTRFTAIHHQTGTFSRVQPYDFPAAGGCFCGLLIFALANCLQMPSLPQSRLDARQPLPPPKNLFKLHISIVATTVYTPFNESVSLNTLLAF